MMFKYILRLLLIISVAVNAMHRMKRSPDKMEVDIPNYSAERESKNDDYQDRADEEADYWHNEEDRYTSEGNQKSENAAQDREKNSEKDEQKYEDEKDYRENQQKNYNSEAEDNYNNNKNNAESHSEANEQHYNEENAVDSRNDYENKGSEANDELSNDGSDKAERYEAKGSDDMKSHEENGENYDIEGNNPTFTYERD